MLKSPKKKLKVFTEACLLIVIFTVIIYFLTWSPGRIYKIIVPAVIIVFAMYGGFRIKKKTGDKLWLTLGALASGFWLFTVLRYFSITQWPLGYADNLQRYFNLMIHHLAMAVCVLVPVILISSKKDVKESLRFGKWKMRFPKRAGIYVLTASSVGVWIWAFSGIIRTHEYSGMRWAGFLAIALVKAFLTGASEEAGYRGFIQKQAVKRFGPITGIIFQAIIYTAFHLNLGPAFFDFFPFMMSVFTVGLIFGFVSWKTKGIGWAVIIHTGVDLVIEWRNILPT